MLETQHMGHDFEELYGGLWVAMKEGASGQIFSLSGRKEKDKKTQNTLKQTLEYFLPLA